LNFNSLEFLVLFLPITFVAFHAAPMRLRLWVLVVASFVFYGVSGPEVLLAFVIAILWGYGTALLFARWPSALAIAVAVSCECLRNIIPRNSAIHQLLRKPFINAIPRQMGLPATFLPSNQHS